MPQSELDQYNNEFNLAVAYIQQFTPPNVALRYTKIRDEISQKEILLRFDNGITQLKKEWESLPTEEQEKRLLKSGRNLKLDTTKFTKKELREKYFESTMVHDAFIFTEWENGIAWAFRNDMIPIKFRYTNKWGLHLKSSPASTVQFWVGYGVLEKRNGKYLPNILTYNQYLEVRSKLKDEPCEIFKGFLQLSKIPILL